VAEIETSFLYLLCSVYQYRISSEDEKCHCECVPRREEVLLIKKLGYQRCKQIKDAGRRWIAEIVFSSIKRVLGEDLLSKKFSTQKVEAGLKVMLYNQFMNL